MAPGLILARTVIFPWLAFGHLIPSLELAKFLASKGHHVSFVSTPKNTQRLSPHLPNLSPLITFINLPFPQIENLPENPESMSDVPLAKANLFMKAFDELQPHFTQFLENSTHPDWIIHDYACYWLPEFAAKHNIPCIFFCPFNAASLSFMGPPKGLLSSGQDSRFTSLDCFTTVPKWIPFPSNIAYRFHEILPYFERVAVVDDDSGASDVSEAYRFGVAIRNCEFVVVRSCLELEPEWINLLSELYEKPVLPVGSLHPLTQDWETTNQVQDDDDPETWLTVRDWLDKQNQGSVIYVAFGTETPLTENQVTELAIGLEQSNLPFFWVLRTPPGPGSSTNALTMLPNGFQDRTTTGGRSMIWTSWAPQQKILAHPSVGGYFTHCGWNSVIEALGFGQALVLCPFLSDQGLNARLLEGKKLGLEIPRNEQDGSFTSESVAKSIRMVMVDKEGEMLRSNARKMKGVLGDKTKMVGYLDRFVQRLYAHKRQLSAASDQ